MSDDTDKSVESENAGKKKASGLMGKLMIGGFVLGMVVLQLLIAMLFLPSSSGSAEANATNVEGQVGEEMDEDTEFLENEKNPVVEVELGSFNVISTQPSSDTQLRIDFQLFGIVMEKDESAFLERFERRKYRIREQVIVTVRNSDHVDLQDASLGLIKRRVLTKVNRALGKQLIRAIVIPEFTFVEL